MHPRNKQSITAISALLAMLAFGLAFAGQYSLVKGKGLEICEAYGRNFEAFPASMPMACGRQYDPAIKEFSAPEWRKIDLKKHFELYKQAEYYLQNLPRDRGMHSTDEGVREHLKYLEAHLDEMKVELWVTRLNLGGNGNPANILAVRHLLGCGPLHEVKTPKTELYVVNDALTHIDDARQQNWGGALNNYSIELYRGKPHFETYIPDDGWGNLFTKSGQFYVAREVSSNKEGRLRYRMTTVCEFHYTPATDQ